MENRLYVDNRSELSVATDRSGGRARGFALVPRGSAADARAALRALNGALFDERRLRVMIVETFHASRRRDRMLEP
ncbi:MAG TPA: hypothetical protein VIF62_06505 [Labilithrix sp.]